MPEQFADTIPLWATAPLSLLLILASMEIGYHLGRWRRKRTKGESDGPVGVMVGAMVGLLAFMLAFTFGLATARYETRRQIIVDEANAIGTAYLRAGMLKAPHADASQSMLREYLSHREELMLAGRVADAIAKSEELQRRLWREATLAVRTDPAPIPTGIYVQSLNEVIDIHTLRVNAGLHSRVPLVVWIALLGLTAVSMAGVGYQTGVTERSRSLAEVGLAVAFSLVIFLVADLDRPGEGVMRTNRWALEDLERSLTPPPSDEARTGG